MFPGFCAKKNIPSLNGRKRIILLRQKNVEDKKTLHFQNSAVITKKVSKCSLLFTNDNKLFINNQYTCKINCTDNIMKKGRVKCV